jgi:hypothetical protein
MASTTTTTVVAATTTTVRGPVVLATEGKITTGVRDDETVFTLTHDPVGFADLELTRQPGGILEDLGYKGGVWDVEEIVPGTETSPGEYVQIEIHRLWPPDEPVDVLWLTDYSGVTRDTLTGYTPEPGDTFTLFDALVLEGELDQFGLHADCEMPDGEIGAALLYFEAEEPVPLVAWAMDRETMTLVELDDPAAIQLGDCLTPQARS